MIYRKECGLEKFVPSSLAETMKRKELRKLLGHFLKLNSSLTAGGGNGSSQKSLTALQAKLHYLKIISDLPSYGAKCFSTNMSVSIILYLLEVFHVIIFFVNKNIGSNKEIHNFLSGFKRRNCDPHQSQVWVKSNQ